MAATVQIYRLTGAGSAGAPYAATSTQIDGQTNRAATADDAAPGTNNPIPVPTTSVDNYSYWVTTRLYISSAPATSITNLKWYTDGGNTMGTGVTLKVGVAGSAGSGANGYVQAGGTVGTTGSLLSSANHAGLTSDTISTYTSNAFVFTSAAPLTVSGSIGAASGWGTFRPVVYQVAVASTAGPGPTGAETITFQYDET